MRELRMTELRPHTQAKRSIEIEAELLDEKERAALSTPAARLWRRISNSSPHAIPGLLSFGEAIWPSRFTMKGAAFTPKLILVPLERLGAVQGFSGSRVMIGY